MAQDLGQQSRFPRGAPAQPGSLFMPVAGEAPEAYAARLRELHAELTTLLSAVERGLVRPARKAPPPVGSAVGWPAPSEGEPVPTAGGAARRAGTARGPNGRETVAP